MVRSPKLANYATLALSALVLLTTLVGVGTGALALRHPAWGIMGFESVALVAAALGVIAGTGRFQNGFGLALICVAGTIAVASLFGFLEARPNFASRPELARLLRPLLALRLGSALCIAGVGALTVLVRDTRSWGFVIRAILLALPVGAAGVLVATGKIGWVTQPRSGFLEAVRIAGILIGSVTLGGLLSASGHLLIRAFEQGRLDDGDELAGESA